MIRKPISRRLRIVLGLASVLAVIFGYTLLSIYQHQINPADTTIPGWGQMLAGVQKVLEVQNSGERWLVSDAWATGLRLFLGLSCGVVGSLLLGMHMGCFPKFEALLYPLLTFLAKIPPTAAVAVFMVIAGLGMPMYVGMITFGILPTMSLAVYLSVRAFPEELQYKAYTLGASHAEVVWSLIFRHVLPRLIESTRLVIGPAMVYLIAAEMIFSDVGFGYRIRYLQRLLHMDVIYIYLVLLAAFGFFIDYLLRRIEHWLCPWHIQE